MNRKLIRPSLTELKEQATTTATVNNNGNSSSGNARPQQRKKPVPPEQTNAENFYYVKQMQSKTPMVIVMLDGEVIRGVLEWYDRNCIKVHRNGEPNLLIYKAGIKYLYKENPED